MELLKKFYNKYLSKINKYWLVVIVFVIAFCTVGEGRMLNRYHLNKKISELDTEIKQYEDRIADDKSKLKNLQTDRDGLEKFAREEYLMKKADEDLFIIKK